MKFTVVTKTDNYGCGELFYQLPDEYGMSWATEEVSALCRKAVEEMYGCISFAVSRLECELELMLKTNTAIDFLVVHEVALLSKEEGYPILVHGNLSGSLIAFLLGITTVNPLSPHYRCEHCSGYEGSTSRKYGADLPDKACPKCGNKMIGDGYDIPIWTVWKSAKEPKPPCFEFELASEVVTLVHDRLDRRFGHVRSDTDLYKSVYTPESRLCGNIGALAKLTGDAPEPFVSDKDVLLRVLRNFADDRLAEFAEWAADGITFDNENSTFFESLKSLDNISVRSLSEIYGYSFGSFRGRKSLDKLSDPGFFVLADDFGERLLSIGFPPDLVSDIVKRGVWSNCGKTANTELREGYLSLLDEYDAPEDIREYFDEVKSLWEASPCIARIHAAYALAWYQVNYPEEYSSVVSEKE